MRKPQDLKILRALANRPKGWKELLEITKVSKGGLSYILTKLKKDKLIQQIHRGGDYYLTLDGDKKLTKLAIIEGLYEKDTIERLKEASKREQGYFADLIPNDVNNLPVGYLFYPSGKVRGWLPKRRLTRQEKTMILSAIETLVETIYDTPKTRYDKNTETFHTMLNEEQSNALQDFALKGGLTNIAGAFKLCFENGLSQTSYKKNSDVSLSQNIERWPNVNEAWIKNRFGDDIRAPYLTAMDLLETKLEGQKMKEKEK